jgi:hypothetical protein
MIGLGVLGMVMGFLTGSSQATLIWMGFSYALVAWMAWEHYGFSSLLERRDAEIRRLQEAIKV